MKFNPNIRDRIYLTDFKINFSGHFVIDKNFDTKLQDQMLLDKIFEIK